MQNKGGVNMDKKVNCDKCNHETDERALSPLIIGTQKRVVWLCPQCRGADTEEELCEFFGESFDPPKNDFRGTLHLLLESNSSYLKQVRRKNPVTGVGFTFDSKGDVDSISYYYGEFMDIGTSEILQRNCNFWKLLLSDLRKMKRQHTMPSGIKLNHNGWLVTRATFLYRGEEKTINN
jgi:hypothetical protein